MHERALHLHIRRLVAPAEAPVPGGRSAAEFANALEQALSLRISGAGAAESARRRDATVDAIADAVLRQAGVTGRPPGGAGGGRQR